MAGRLPSWIALIALPFAPTIKSLIVCVTVDSGLDMPARGLESAIHTIHDDDDMLGFNQEARVAVLRHKLGFNYTLRVLPSYGEVMVATRVGACDIGWAAFFMFPERERCVPDSKMCRNAAEVLPGPGPADSDWTPYRCCVDFLAPYMNYGHAILSRTPKERSFFAALLGSTIKDAFFIDFMVFMFLVVVAFGHLVYFAERGSNSEQFPSNYLDGIDDAMWWAVVTATTVGYGDKVPVTATGRFFSVLYMVVGIALFSIISGERLCAARSHARTPTHHVGCAGAHASLPLDRCSPLRLPLDALPRRPHGRAIHRAALV